MRYHAIMRHHSRLTNGDAIQTLRFEKGFSLHELGTRAGVDGGYIGRIERGERQGRPRILRKLADALDVAVADITRVPDPV